MRVRVSDRQQLKELVAALLDADCVLVRATADEIEVVSVARRVRPAGDAAAGELDAIDLRFFLGAWRATRPDVEVVVTP